MSAGAFLVNKKANAPLKACMSAHHLTLSDTWVDQFQYGGPDPAGLLGAGEWLTPLGLRRASYRAQALAPVQRRVEEVSTRPATGVEATPEYAAALKSCGGPETTVDRDDERPAVTTALLTGWQAMVDEIDRDLAGELTSYKACMAESGFDVAAPSALSELIADALPHPFTIPAPGDSTPEWAAALDFEGRALKADADCRAATYARAVALAVPRVEGFLVDHAADLVAARSGWEGLMRRANAAGWNPPTGASPGATTSVLPE